MKGEFRPFIFLLSLVYICHPDLYIYTFILMLNFSSFIFHNSLKGSHSLFHSTCCCFNLFQKNFLILFMFKIMSNVADFKSPFKKMKNQCFIFLFPLI